MIRRLFVYLFFIATLFFIAQHHSEFTDQLQTVKTSDFAWLGVALIIQFIYLLSYGWLLKYVLGIVGIKAKARTLARTFCESLTINTVTPTGGFGGIAYLAYQATKDSNSKGKDDTLKSSAAVILTYILDYTALASIVLLACAYLFSHQALKVYELGTAVLLVLLVVSFFIGLALAIWSSSLLLNALTFAERFIDWLNKGLQLRQPIAFDAKPVYADLRFLINLFQTNRSDIAKALLIALVSRFIDIFVLVATALAFGQFIPFSVITTAYAMAMLFWIVSVTPQGIGVVEGAMIAVLTGFGVPFITASSITLSYRFIIFWIPFFYGIASLSLRRLQPFDFRAKFSEIIVQLMAVMTLGIGIITVLSSILPSLMYRIHILRLTFHVQTLFGARLTTALVGLGLIALSNGIRRRKKVAWWFTLFLLVISIFANLLKGLDFEEASLSAVGIVLLLVSHRYYVADSDPPSMRQGLKVLIGAVLLTVAYGVTGFYLLDNFFAQNFSLHAAALQVFHMFFGSHSGPVLPVTRYGRYFADSIYVVAYSSIIYASFMLLRPVLYRHPASSAEHARAKAIVEAHGKSSIARFTLFDDKRYFFSSHDLVFAYVVYHRIAVVLGDPIGDKKHFSSSLSEFEKICQKHDWIPAFYQTMPEDLKQYADLKYQSVSIGEEGIVPLREWSLEGSSKKSLRNAYNRITRMGYRFEVLTPPINRRTLDELEEVSLEWLSLMHGSEKYYSLGRFDRDYIGSSHVAVVRSANNIIVAFANIVPEFQKPEITADLMRRRSDTENGLMEYLFVSLINYAKGKGYATFSLGLSPLAHVGDPAGDRAIEKTLRFAFEHFNAFYSFSGLHNFKNKFNPKWETRYLMYKNSADLPAIWLAIIRADSGGSLWEEIKHFLRIPLF